MAMFRVTAVLLLLAVVAGCSPQAAGGEEKSTTQPITKTDKPREKMEQATFGGGCFWCTEAVFLGLEGVEKVISGYSGGSVEDPTYKEVCSGTTGHAEVIHIEYDPTKVNFAELLEVHFKTHDPTTLNRQGNDVGTQYRSAVFYHNQEQKELAEKAIKELNNEGAYEDPIVTEVTEFEKFWPAEDYHQNYLALNPEQPYCRLVVQPKVDKFRKVFKDKLKKQEAK